MNSRILAGLALGAILASGAAWSQTVELTADHPDRYIVQRGDTLWDISGRFLTEPWLWPEVWEANPQIENPHLIYPGDEVRLTYRDGRPILSLRRGGGVRLSPRVREEALDVAVPTIPVDAIHQFLIRPRVVTEAEIRQAPYVISVGRESLLGAPGERVFARGIDGGQKRYAVYRRGQEYFTPDDTIVPTTHGVSVRRARRTDEVLGIEAIHVADAVVEESGDPATLLVIRASRELRVGDRLMPVVDDEPQQHFLPRPPPGDLRGQIIAVFDGVSQVGELQVVVLNLGARDGLQPGHVLAVYQRGELIVDRIALPPPDGFRTSIELDPDLQGGPDGLGMAANDAMLDVTKKLSRFWSRISPRPQPWQSVRLPDQRAGTVMVFRPFERVSYALVMEATRAMHVTDNVRKP